MSENMEPRKAPGVEDADADKTLVELEAKNGAGKVGRVSTAMGYAYFRKPTRGEWKRATQAGLLDQAMKSTADAVEPMARACVLHPDREVFSQWIDEYPAIPVLCAGVLLELAGLTAKEVSGK